MTPKPWATELSRIAAEAPTRIAEHYAALSRTCNLAAESNAEIVPADGGAPYDPIAYLANNEEAFLNAILKGLAANRLDLAGETVRNLGPLYEIRSHLVHNYDNRWSDILHAVSTASEKNPDDELHGIALVQLSRRDRVLCRWDSARKHAMAAVDWYAARADRRFRLMEAYARECLGEVHRAIGSDADLDEAIAQFKVGLRCVAEADAAADDKLLAELKLHDRLGYALYLRRHFMPAVKEFSQAIRLNDASARNTAELRRALNNFGKVLRSRRRLHAARRCFECSARLHASHDMRSESIRFHEIGLLYRDEGDIERAIEYLKESRRIKQTFDDRHGMGLSEMELGHIYLNMGREDEATAHFEDARRFLTPGFAGLFKLERFLQHRAEQQHLDGSASFGEANTSSAVVKGY